MFFRKKLKNAIGPEELTEKQRKIKEGERLVESKVGEKLSESLAVKKKEEEKWFEPEGELAVDVYQTSEELVIQSTIAGVKPEDLDVSIEGDVVIIKGNRERPAGDEERNYFYQECYWGAFSKEIILPVEADSSRATASMKDGILTVRIPKIAREKRRKITVN